MEAYVGIRIGEDWKMDCQGNGEVKGALRPSILTQY